MATKRKQFFVPLAVDYAADDKIIEAGPMAELLYVRSLAFAKRTVTNGLIKRAQLNVVGLGLSSLPKLAQTLVAVGLWTETHDGHWVISAWLKHNQSTGVFDAETLAGKKANHVRWKHSGPAETCPICLSDADSDRTPTGQKSESKDRDRGETEESRARGEDASSHDDDKREDIPLGSSSSDFDAVVSILTGHAEDACPITPISPKKWREGVERNIRTEQADDIARLLSQGSTPQEVAQALTNDSMGVRASMRKRGLEVHAPKGWEAAS